ncbi:MAG TPA: DNA-3-methyladenine glycosylase [Abditibacteriaceae bacterium]|nr:DNA-3-methyladenine glycosylase [Abditibacteriaceae bacterium]
MDFNIARRHLAQADSVLAEVIARTGPCTMGREPDAWRALASSIIGQQVSVHAARAIRNRFAALVPGHDFPTPDAILTLPDDILRAAGLSANKTRAIVDLARHFADGVLIPAQLASLDDEAVIAALLPVRGIGRWTAEMFLIFSLGRPDVLVVDDLGLRNAMRNLYALDALPVPAVMSTLAAPWRPFRSVASWYLWRSLDNEPKLG